MHGWQVPPRPKRVEQKEARFHYSAARYLNLVLFLDRLDPDGVLVIEETVDVNWLAWTEARRRA